MKTAVFLFAVPTLFSLVCAGDVSPLSKVLEMISSLQAKIILEGQKAQTVYEEFAEWCEDQSKNVGFEIKTAKGQIADLNAVIDEETAMVESLTTKVEDLSSSVATDETDLKAATAIRKKEAADFSAEESELINIIDTLERAIGILEKEIKSGAASMLQMNDINSFTQAMSAMVEASVFNSADAQRLTALVQTSEDSDDSDSDMDMLSLSASAAPASAVYEGHSGGIIETMAELLEKAQTQLDDARKKETTSLNQFELLKQSLTDKLKFAKKEMDEAKKSMAGSNERKATSTAELDVTTKDLKADEESLSVLHHDCMMKARDFEAETKSRSEELKALAEAKAVIKESTGAASSLDQISFLQLRRSLVSAGADLGRFQVVKMVRDLARKHKSAALSHLALKMASAIRASSRTGDDPFAKVKGLIKDMLGRLIDEANEDASHKAYCDKEMAESKAKQEDKTDEIEKLTTSIDMMAAKSAKLKEEVAELQKALAELAKSQAEMDKLRSEEHASFEKNKAEAEKGLEGIKLALKVLREYYGAEDKSHTAAEGAGGGIIGLLEVCESDFTKGLAEMEATEDASQAEYEQLTKENEIDKAVKDQDVKYKTKESTDLDKASAETASDLSNVQAELQAVNEYYAKLKEECVEKAEPYEQRKARREAELAGLKEALDILAGNAVLLQRSSKRSLRMVRSHSKSA
jgi:hypothetical protein